MTSHHLLIMLSAVVLPTTHAVADGSVCLDPASSVELTVPMLSDGAPRAGVRVAVTPPEYSGTRVFHTVYLPANWIQDGPSLPVVFEYTGNHYPPTGSTGEPEDAGLGYGLSAGRYIWVSLPYITSDGQDNAVRWWGDARATVEYAKLNVPRIIDEFACDRNAVFLCGFSRGAIAVNYIGLHDDEIAQLWSAFITHDHFDGVKKWTAPWGAPLTKYQTEAAARLRRVASRPYLVCQNGGEYGSEEFVRSVLPAARNFTYRHINVRKALGEFPNAIAKAPHTDRWLVKPGTDREFVWTWMNQQTAKFTASRSERP